MYCNSQPCLLPEATFYRDLGDANEDESTKIKAARGISIDAARLLISKTAAVNLEAGPSTHTISRMVQRMATTRVSQVSVTCTNLV